MAVLKQIVSVTAMNLRSIRQRLRPSLVVVIGIAGVVAVLASMLALTTGLGRMTQNSGRPDRAIVLSVGANEEQMSILGPDAVAAIADAPGVIHDASGKPLASPEVVLSTTLKGRRDSDATAVPLRGIGPMGLAVHPEFKIIKGRLFTPGLRELVVGRTLSNQIAGLAIGRTVNIRGNDWLVVGVLGSNGGMHESELIGDADTINSSTGRSGVQSVVAVLTSKEAFKSFRETLLANTAAPVEAIPEPLFFAGKTAGLQALFTFVAYVIGGIMALGATFGAVTTVSTMISSRSVEIATLRAIGFGPFIVVLSVLAETIFLAILGGVAGGALAWFGFNGFTVSTLAGGQQMAFDLAVTPRLLLIGTLWAVAIGLISGVFPATRAARLPVAAVLRAS